MAGFFVLPSGCGLLGSGRMGLIETARDALKDIPISDILRERLASALDYSSKLEAENRALELKVATVHAKLEIEKEKHDASRVELQRFKDEHAEEIRIYRSVELRRGKRTGAEWAAFCPKCHMPVGVTDKCEVFCSGDCGWLCDIGAAEVSMKVRQLNGP